MNHHPATYQLFNVFGMIRAERYRVTALATAVLPSGQSVEKTVARDLLDAIGGIEKGVTVVILFAAMLRDGQPPQIVVQQLSKRVGGPDVLGEQAVQDTLYEVMGKL